MTDAPLVRTDRLDHVHLYVEDRPAAIDWYHTVLGLVVVGQTHDQVSRDHPIFLAPGNGGDPCLSLFIGARPEGGDRTVAFHADADRFVRFARALPHPALRGYDGTPLLAPNHHDYGLALTFNFLDPAGNHIELVTYEAKPARAGMEDLT